MKKENRLFGHILAIVTIFFWGTTFVSTKVLLRSFNPLEILFFRFIIGYLALVIAYPYRMKIKDRKQEIIFALAGLTGVNLYFLFENIALTYTTASNVGVLVSVAPFFTGIATKLVYKDTKLHHNFFIGFLLSIVGLSIISFNGAKLELNPLGDILAIGAAALWAVYSLFITKINYYGYPVIQSTRRIFLYAIVFMIPLMPIMDFQLGLYRFADPLNIFNIIFLGLGASAICFATWNHALKILGTIVTSNYIYLVPIISLIFSSIILNERLTPLVILGTLFTLSGLVVSGIKKKDED